MTVQTQPSHPSQTCTVTSGSGTMATPMSPTWRSTCTTTTFTVGGTVSGLLGHGLVLRNNGGNDLTIGANGAFTFATPLATGAAYAVTVLTQPTAPARPARSPTARARGRQRHQRRDQLPTNTLHGRGHGHGLPAPDWCCATTANDLPIAPTARSPSARRSRRARLCRDGADSAHAPEPDLHGHSGTGTVGSVNVTNVAITCMTNTFTVGGTVIGLRGSGLVLRNNGANKRSIANGAFTFRTSIASGAAYAVTVLTQPAPSARPARSPVAGDRRRRERQQRCGELRLHQSESTCDDVVGGFGLHRSKHPLRGHIDRPERFCLELLVGLR